MKKISYSELETNEGKRIQRGMNFRTQKSYSTVLMSTKGDAPYGDKIRDDGRIVYEGHDVPKDVNKDKKSVDQRARNSSGSLTENGKFLAAAEGFEEGERRAEKVKVYRKISSGVWEDKGFYDLIGADIVSDGTRNVFKFLLEPHSKQ